MIIQISLKILENFEKLKNFGKFWNFSVFQNFLIVKNCIIYNPEAWIEKFFQSCSTKKLGVHVILQYTERSMVIGFCLLLLMSILFKANPFFVKVFYELQFAFHSSPFHSILPITPLHTFSVHCK